ncbi:MAG: hypothetical protein WAL75_24785 [Terracidiphilus sp.]
MAFPRTILSRKDCATDMKNIAIFDIGKAATRTDAKTTKTRCATV